MMNESRENVMHYYIFNLVLKALLTFEKSKLHYFIRCPCFALRVWGQRNIPGAGQGSGGGVQRDIAFLIKIFFFQVSECETNFNNSFLTYFYTHTLFKVHYLKSFSLYYSAWNMWETQIKKRLYNHSNSLKIPPFYDSSEKNKGGICRDLA